MKTTLWILSMLAALVSGCAYRNASSQGTGSEPLTSLGVSLDPLKEQFNRDESKLRVLALFSPT